jgi:predicted amidophosphoribosyltransferase
MLSNPDLLMNPIFSNPFKKVTHKYNLQVDDVVTTGSTMEACVEALLEAGAKEVSLAALGIAKN